MFSARRIFTALIILFSSFLFTTTPVLAQQTQNNTTSPCAAASPTPTPTDNSGIAANPCNWNADAQTSFTGNSLGTYFLNCLVGVDYGGTTLTGDNSSTTGGNNSTSTSNSDYQRCSTTDQNGNVKLYNSAPNGGASAALNHVIAALYTNPPTSTTDYLAMMGRNAGIIPQAYAAGPALPGTGDQVIEPVLALWQFMRNLAYLAFIIIFVVIGFMIMFRKKINQQTVISFQSAIPSLIVGLILVTFSYFVAALIVDMAFVGMKIVAGIFFSVYCTASGSGVDPCSTSGFGNPNDLAQGSNIFNLFIAAVKGGNFFGNVIQPITQLIRSVTIDPLANNVGPKVPGTNFGVGRVLQYIPPVPGNIFFDVNALSFLLGGALGLLITIILVIAILIQIGRLAISLIKSYITIMVLTIVGPLMILMASIPGNSKNLDNWWRGLLGNVLVFPAVFAGFMFSQVLLNAPNAFNSSASSAVLPFLGGLPVGLLRGILGYGVLLGLPAIPPMVTKAIGGGAGGADVFTGAALAGAMTGYGGVQTLSSRAFRNQLAARQGHGQQVQNWNTARRLGNPPPPGAPVGGATDINSRPWWVRVGHPRALP